MAEPLRIEGPCSILDANASTWKSVGSYLQKVIECLHIHQIGGSHTIPLDVPASAGLAMQLISEYL